MVLKARNGILFSLTIFIYALILISAFPPEEASAADSAPEWTWDVLVFPPDEGWESMTGQSVQRTLMWHQAEISEMGDGVKGNDIRFVFLPALKESAMKGFTIPSTPKSIAVFSFASFPVDRELLNAVQKTRLPLLLARGENVPLHNADGRILPFAFALDLFRDYRSRVFVQYAAEKLEPQTRLGILGSRFTLNEEREAKICFDLFSDAGFMPMPFWIDATVTDTFKMVEQEVKSYSEGVLISYLGGMGSKELWRGIMSVGSPYRLWYGGTPDRSFLSYKAMMFADQNWFLDTRGGFEQLKRDLWSSRTTAVTDKVAAGRANALVHWLTSALKTLPGHGQSTDRSALFARLAEVRDIPFGTQTLSIDPKTHRPRSRMTYVFEVRNRDFFFLDQIEVEGLEYKNY